MRKSVARSPEPGGKHKNLASGHANTNLSLLKSVEKCLSDSGALSPRAEAETLIRHFGKMDRVELFTGKNPLPRSARAAIGRALHRRRGGMPLAYLMKEAFFWGYGFFVKRGVLIPRPETERLVEEVLGVLDTHFKGKEPHILDLGTGSGCIAVCLTLERPHCRMTALDASQTALAVARKNIKRHGLSQKIQLVKGRFFESFGTKRALWDVIVSNPPYVPTGVIPSLSKEVRNEPRLALDGGPEGLDALEAILEKAPRYLKPGGFLCMETGEDHSKKLSKILSKNKHYKEFNFAKDLNGADRILIARRAWTN